MFRDLFFRHVAQTSGEPPALDIVRGQGIFLYDRSGKEYIDLIAGISVSNAGHANPEIIRAVNEQMTACSHVMVYGEDILEPQVALAGKLSELSGGVADNVFFVNSGTEAIEGAVKLARRYTGRYEVVSFTNCYHGSSHLCLSLQKVNPLSTAYRPLVNGIRNLPFNDMAALERIDDRCACVVIEPVQGEAGARPATMEFMIALEKRCRKTGTLLIADEIQTGMGRTGKWFAFEHYGIRPDIIAMAKALGGGLPLGCFMARKEIMQVLSENPPLGHITTFGGNPVSCAASLAAITYIEKNRLHEQVQEKEKCFRQQLKHPRILEVTGKGLLLAVHLESAENVMKAISLCVNDGLISDWFLFNASALRIAPPLTITHDEITRSCRILLSALDRL